MSPIEKRSEEWGLKTKKQLQETTTISAGERPTVEGQGERSISGRPQSENGTMDNATVTENKGRADKAGQSKEKSVWAWTTSCS